VHWQTCDGSSPTTLASQSVSASFESASLNRFDSVRRRQMVRLRKRSDWFLSPTLSGGASAGVMHDSQSRSLSDQQAHPVEVSLTAESSANPPSYSECCAASELPQLCVNDSDVMDSDTSPVRQHHTDEGYSSRSAGGENSVSPFPAAAENSRSSPTTSAAPNTWPILSSESSPASAKHLLQSDTHYFLVDRFYGGSTVGEKAENGDAC